MQLVSTAMISLKNLLSRGPEAVPASMTVDRPDDGLDAIAKAMTGMCVGTPALFAACLRCNLVLNHFRGHLFQNAKINPLTVSASNVVTITVLSASKRCIGVVYARSTSRSPFCH